MVYHVYDNYLLNNINGKNIKVKFYDFSLDQFNIVNQAIQGKVRIKGDQYNFYNNQTQSKNPYVHYTSSIGAFDKNYEGYMGYTFTKSYFDGSFSAMITHLSLNKTDIGIDEDNFHKILCMDRNTFDSNTLFIRFPLFLKEQSPNVNYI